MPSPVVLIMRRAARGGGGIRTRDLSCPAGGAARKNLTYISSGAGPAAPDRIRKAAPAGQDTIPSGADRRRRTRYAAELVDFSHVMRPVSGRTWALSPRAYRLATACAPGVARVSFPAAPRVRAETLKLGKLFCRISKQYC